MHGHGVTAAPPIHLLLSFSHSLFNSYCIRCGDIAHQMKIKAGAWCGSRQSGVRCDCRTQCRMDVSYKIYVVDWYCNCDMAFSLCAHSFRSEAVKMAFSFSLLLFAITLCEWCDLICDMDRWQAGKRKSKSLALSVPSAHGFTIVRDLYAWHSPLYWWATGWPPSQTHSGRHSFDFKQRTDSCLNQTYWRIHE